MAGQPDISAILAALGGAGTPSNASHPPAQPPPSAGYPGAMPITSPSNPVGGLPLPQPSSSGNLDLSAIKPMNSGSVSLADAIAKAREKAQSREDPRSASRAYRHSRSRSRSPPRRDNNFRDNYNPYRDERRDDRGRAAANGRDRSFSPQRRGAFSPSAGARGPGFDAGRARSPPANAETNSEVITVASSDVGLIIGRAGENLRRVEAETGARVQFLSGPENSGPLRQCRISGTPRQREDAKADIFRVAQENPNGTRQGSIPSSRPGVEPPVDDKSLQIMVPDKTVGLIIGRGGETIRDLQDRSACHVNITAENKSINGLRPVNLIGSYESQMKAKEMIMEVVQSDTRAEGDKGPPQRGSYDNRGGAGYDSYGAQAPVPAPAPYGADPYGGGAGDGKLNDMIQVPSEAVGMIIGKGGETIKDMQNQSSCKINVSPPSGADIQRDIGLIGTRQAIESAKRLIWEKVDAVRAKQGGRTRADDQRSPYGGGSDPYSQRQPAQYGQSAYGGQPAAHSAPAAAAPPASADPYAAYGGYQAYLAMWYAAAAAQGQGGAPPPA